MPLAEAAATLGVPVNTLRSRFKAGKIRGERDNSGRLFVWINPASEGSKKTFSNNAKPVRNDGEIEALKGHIETLTGQLALAEARASEWQAKAEASQAETLRLWRAFTARINAAERSQREPRSLWSRIFG